MNFWKYFYTFTRFRFVNRYIYSESKLKFYYYKILIKNKYSSQKCMDILINNNYTHSNF